MRTFVRPCCVLVFAAVAAIACLAGCAADQGRPGPTDRDRPGDDLVRWPFWPNHMRIHPLTRVVTDTRTGLPVIEARVEFLDPEGHTTKGSGALRIDLLEGEGESEANVEASASWHLDLGDATINRVRFDDVTRTYLVPLEIEPDQELPSIARLRAYFESADGRSLASSPLLLRTR